ncbi:MAG: aminopeptidase P family protein [Clostridia bacterium]|nr:aminopeptidase P family protein [Clostridia bacterium]
MEKERIARVVKRMKEMGLDQTLISAPSSLFYLTGKWIFPGERMVALYINDLGEATLFANRLFALSGSIDIPLVEYDDTEDCIAILAERLMPGEIGIDKDWPSRFTIRLMEARDDLTPKIGSPCIDQTRLYKDARELDLMRESSLKNDSSILNTIRQIRPGMTEVQLADIYLRESSIQGSTGPSFEPLICFGANCAEPHHVTDQTPLKTGDSIIIDVGLTWRNYCSDMTRTVFLGKATDEQKRVYDIVCAANAAGRAAVHPGIPMKEIDRAARKVIEDAGYGKYFIHRTGHGIGLEVHEFPDVSASSEAIAMPGMCFSVEPGIYLPGRFGVRVEDLVAVTEDGCETLNHAPRELTEIAL